ncbi:MAG TPA: hypothetical protein VGK93_03380 [Candidatus Eisenbacteria bacterium]|jgi:hypothetical protein
MRLRRAQRWLGFGLPAAGVLCIGACAPRLALPPKHDVELRAHRYLATLEERAAHGGAIAADAVLWAELSGDRKLPGVQASVYLAAPDGVRLKVGSMFGTAVVLGAHGDSLRAYLPGRRLGLKLDQAHDSLGLPEPGVLAYRALSAAWHPPPEAWSRALWVDSLLEVTWVDAEDTLALTVGASGLPVRVTARRGDGASWRADYRAWDRSAGAPWPSHVDFAHRDVRLAYKVSRLIRQAHPDPMRLAVRIPDGAEQLTLEDLREVFERLGSF